MKTTPSTAPNSAPITRMRREALEAPAVIARQLTSDDDRLQSLVQSLKSEPPRAVLTVARGSSDHAAQYLAYLVMSHTGRLVTSLPMSLVTLHHTALETRGLLSLALSQSGQSPDLIEPTRQFRDGGARTVALVNDIHSPLAQACQWVLPLHAGVESSVAATKSFLAQMTASARLVAHWCGDQTLQSAVNNLPQVLAKAAPAWDDGLSPLHAADRLYVIGRGTGLAAAQELALKFKEVCGLQAEAFSAAEVRHGPLALIKKGFPVLVLGLRGAAHRGLLDLALELRTAGAQVLLAAPPDTPECDLPLHATGHEDLDPIALVQSFYPAVESLARLRGVHPDHPPNLSKVTRTQ